MRLFSLDIPPAASVTASSTTVAEPPIDDEDVPPLPDDDELPPIPDADVLEPGGDDVDETRTPDALPALPLSGPDVPATVPDELPVVTLDAVQRLFRHTRPDSQSMSPVQGRRQNPSSRLQRQPCAHCVSSLHAYWRSEGPGRQALASAQHRTASTRPAFITVGGRGGIANTLASPGRGQGLCGGGRRWGPLVSVVMVRALQTTSAAICAGRDQDVPDAPALPAAPTERFRAHEAVGALLLVMGALVPHAAPALLAGFFALSVWHGVMSGRREQAFVDRLARLAQDQAVRLGARHPSAVALRRYHRLMHQLLVEPRALPTIRGTASRWALATRLHHRCQHLLQYPDYLVPGPRLLPAVTQTAPTWLPSLASRARQRRIGRRRTL